MVINHLLVTNQIDLYTYININDNFLGRLILMHFFQNCFVPATMVTVRQMEHVFVTLDTVAPPVVSIFTLVIAAEVLISRKFKSTFEHIL